MLTENVVNINKVAASHLKRYRQGTVIPLSKYVWK